MIKKTKFVVDGVSLDGASKCRVEVSSTNDGVVITVKPYKKNTAYWCRMSAAIPHVVSEHRKREEVK